MDHEKRQGEPVSGNRAYYEKTRRELPAAPRRKPVGAGNHFSRHVEQRPVENRRTGGEQPGRLRVVEVKRHHARLRAMIVALLILVVLIVGFFLLKDKIFAVRSDVPFYPQEMLQLTTFTFEEGGNIPVSEVVTSKPMIPPPRIELPAIVMNNPAAVGKVCITFDDGPYVNYTDQYLALLAEYDVPAVFFCPANRVAEYPELTRKFEAAGHELASHSKQHDNLANLSEEALQADFQETVATFKEIAGHAPQYLRPPYGSYNEHVLEVAKSYGQQPVFWSIDTNDWRGYSVDTMVNNILNNLSPGAIILFHEGKQNTLAALPRVFQAVRDAGYEFVSMGELLADYPQSDL